MITDFVTCSVSGIWSKKHRNRGGHTHSDGIQHEGMSISVRVRKLRILSISHIILKWLLRMRALSSRLVLGLIGVGIIALIVGSSYALLAQNATLIFASKPFLRGESAGVTLTLSLDKGSYSVGRYAEVMLVIENAGNQEVGISNPEQPPELIVYDSNMNQLGVWTRFQKSLVMRPPLGPIVLSTGQKYSWAFQWNLGVHSTLENATYRGLPPGNYAVQASITIVLSNSNSAEIPQPSAITLQSNIVQFALI